MSGFIAASVIAVAVLGGVGAAQARDRAVEITRDGDVTIGDLYEGQRLVPGGSVSAEVEIRRIGGGSSSLSLGLAPVDGVLPIDKTPLSTAAIVRVDTPTGSITQDAESLVNSAALLPVSAGSAPSVPLRITISLPSESGNDTRNQVFPFIIRAVAVDSTTGGETGEISGEIPVGGHVTTTTDNGHLTTTTTGNQGSALSQTGATVREGLVLAGVLLLGGLGIAGIRGGLGRRRREQDVRDARLGGFGPRE